MKYASIMASAVCALAMAPMAWAQSATYTPPKTSWGVPDLQGYFSKASLTTLTRPAGVSGLIISAQEADKMFNRNIYTRVAKEEAEDQRAVTSGEEKLALLTDANPDRAYNRYWMDPGSGIAQINGQYRSSWIIEPADGQIPFLKKPKEGISALASVDEEYADLPSNNPEERGNGERCVYHGSGGPPLQNQMYNNIIQIVQSPGHVMILTEQIHEARIITIGTTHGAVPKWGGDSIGRYEGNTLVVETTNVEARQGGMLSPAGKITERFTRANDGQILYEYSVDDPTRYSQVWKAEMPLNVSKEPPYEYACHEGNYSMFNTLSGARAYEREGKVNGKRKAIFAGVAEADE